MMKRIMYSIFKSLYRLIQTLLFRQKKKYGIGYFDVPFKSRIFLKRSFSQQGEDLVLERIITQMGWNLNEKKFYLDIGGFHPVYYSTTYSLYLRGWRGIIIEPQTEAKKLFKIFRPEDIFILALAGIDDGVKKDFHYKIDSPDNLSVSGGTTKKKKFTNTSSVIQINVNLELKRRNITKVDYINIDVEGSELDILKTLDFNYFNPSIISVEVHGDKDLRKKLESEVSKILYSNGYACVAVNCITLFYCKKKLC